MDVDKAVNQLHNTSSLSIIRLAEPIFAARIAEEDQHGNRISNASSTTSQTTKDPAALKADLQHYRDLFAKLRFSYVEQVTKEKFLRTITEDTPEFVAAEENTALDEKNKEQKALLSEKKEDLRGMLQDLEAQARELARRYHEIELQTTQLEMLPIELEELDTQIARLQASKEPQSADPDMRLPLEETLALLAERERDSASISAQIERLQSLLPERQHEIQLLEQELGLLQLRRNDAVVSMQQTQGRKNSDNLIEHQGRWLSSSEAALKLMLDV